MNGIRVIIPPKFRDHILDEIHSGHLGSVKMKSIARGYVYWPGIDNQLEQKTLGCSGCSQVRTVAPQAQLHPWEWPSMPWRQLHIKFAGPILNMMFLVIVDAHSKWPEVIPLKHATSATSILCFNAIVGHYQTLLVICISMRKVVDLWFAAPITQ